MAGQMEGPGQIQEFLEILQRRKWQIALPALFMLSIAIAGAVIVPKKFQVDTMVELRELFLDDGQRQAARDHTSGVAENAPQQLQSPKRIKEVLEMLKWPDYLIADAVEQAEFNERIRDNLRVIVPRKAGGAGSSFVTVEYKDVNSERAQEFLKALVSAWIEQVVERERTRHDVEYQKLLTRQHQLGLDYQKLNGDLTDLRNENNISPTQPTPGQNAPRLEDPNVLRFEASQNRLDQVKTDQATAEGLLELAEAQLAKTDPEIPKVKVTQGLNFVSQIEKLRTEQLGHERKLEGIRPEHPRYKLITRQLEDIDTRIADLELRQTDAEVSQEFVPNPAYLNLESLVQKSKLDVATLATEGGSLRLLLESTDRELKKLRTAYSRDREISLQVDLIKSSMRETANKLLDKRQRREVIYGPAGNPFQIIKDVEPPGSPTDPNPFVIIALGLILGLGMGLGLAVVFEFSSSGFRSASDLNRVLVMPVLGVIGPIVTQVQRRRKLVRRLAVGCLSFVVISSILLMTWAWANDPDLLGDKMNDSIEGFRSLFL